MELYVYETPVGRPVYRGSGGSIPRGLRAAIGAIALATALLGASACGSSSADGDVGQRPIEVAVFTVESRPVPLTRDLPGRVEASRIAEVRARVPGVILERSFREGSDVAEGEVLFRIDPAPMQAAVQRAEAQVARARVAASQTESRAGRYQNLAATRAVSQQEVDDAVAARDAAQADLAAARAALTTARLDLGYATVNAPIAGRIGRAEVTEGALVGQGQATLLATIQRLDPVYVNLTQSVAQVQALRRALARGELSASGQVEVAVLRDDGTPYPHLGNLLYTDVTVDPSTGSVTLRAELPNPDGELLPGEFVRARLAQAVIEEALAVPQQAVRRDATGASVVVVDPEGKAEARPVEVGEAVGDAWLIRSGLQAGERVVVEGLQRVRPGALVNPVPWE